MPNWLRRLKSKNTTAAPMPAAVASAARFEPVPEFSTRLAIESPGAPGREGAEALYKKWASKWQEF